MKIQIAGKEIENAVACHLQREGINVDAYELSINIVAGRAGTEDRIDIDLIKPEPKESGYVESVNTTTDEQIFGTETSTSLD